MNWGYFKGLILLYMTGSASDFMTKNMYIKIHKGTN